MTTLTILAVVFSTIIIYRKLEQIEVDIKRRLDGEK